MRTYGNSFSEEGWRGMEIINDFVGFLGSNIKELAAGVAIVVFVAGTVAWLFKWFQDKRDREKIYKFLRRSVKEKGWAFRTTHAISSSTKIPEHRVSKLCRRDKRIKRNEKEKESWRLIRKTI
jgi:hypothetical protein